MKYDSQGEFRPNGLAKVKLNKKYGIINKKKEIIIPIIYDYVYMFQYNGLTKVQLNNKYGIINIKNEIVSPLIYDYVYLFESNGLAKVQLNNNIYDLNDYGIPNKKKLDLIQDII